MTVKLLSMITVPTPAGIRVRKLPGTVAIIITVFNTVAYFVAIAACTGVYTGSVTGNRQIFDIPIESFFGGGLNTNFGKDLLHKHFGS